MDKKEFSLFAMALRTYFPKENILPNQQAMELWFMQLKDIPYQAVEIALNKWVATNKWSPSISEIREAVAGICEGEIADWGEGWEQVLKAIRVYGMYRPEEALASMDEITRQVVKQIGFREICLSENVQNDRANFRMIYERLAERKKQEAQIPESVRLAIETVQGLPLLEGGVYEK